MFCAISSIIGFCHAHDLPEAKVTIRVIDEEGKAILGADTTVSFQLPSADGTGGADFIIKKGLTGVDGLFPSSSKTLPYIAYGAKKEGYYESTNL